MGADGLAECPHGRPAGPEIRSGRVTRPARLPPGAGSRPAGTDSVAAPHPALKRRASVAGRLATGGNNNLQRQVLCLNWLGENAPDKISSLEQSRAARTH